MFGHSAPGTFHFNPVTPPPTGEMFSLGPYIPAMRAIGNFTYQALDSISLPVLAFVFFCFAILLHFLPRSDKSISLPLSSPNRSKLPNHLPIPPWYSFPKRLTAPIVLAKQLEDMLMSSHSSQSDLSVQSLARRGSRERMKEISLRCGLGTVPEVHEEEQV